MGIKTKFFSSILLLVISAGIAHTKTATIDQEVILRIDRFLSNKYQKGNVPGFAVAIVNNKGIVFSKGYGKSSDKQAISGDTPFAIASLSKAFTALSVMQLVEQGKVNLDDPITQYIPSLSQNNITIRHLLNQTSGFSDRVFPEMKFYSQPDGIDQAVDRMVNIEPISKPGEKFHYHNPNYTLLSKVVEVASRKSFSDYLKDHIFSPLGMKHTINVENTDEFYSQGTLKLPDGYNFVFGYPWKLKEPEWYVQGSAGMVSTVNDMAKWLMMFINKGIHDEHRLLSENSITQMITPPTTANSFYGMGWSVDSERNISHNGILWTSQSEQIILYDKGYGIVFLCNSGLNIFENYGSYIAGIVDILNGEESPVASMPTYWPEIFIALLLFIYLLILFFKFRKLRRPDIPLKYGFKFWTQNILMFMPLILLLLLPQTVTFLSGRVMNWERIFWTMPTVLIFLGVIALMNLLLFLKRFRQANK